MAFSKARRLANLMSSASDTVPASKVNTVLADDAVTTQKIADDAITTDLLANSINTAITANTAKVTNAITTHTGDVTGGAALTIAVDAVDIPMLSASGTPSSTTFLRGDNAWAAPGGVSKASSTPSPTAEGSLFYNTTLDVLYVSNGSAWVPLLNSGPTTTGGTVTISPQNGGSTFSYNLGLNFTDDSDTDAQLTYTLVSGSLPGGCVLPSAGNSAFTGTAANTGATYNFTIRATDTKNSSADQSYTQVISAVTAATGGAITTVGGYRYHTFTSSGTFAVTAVVANQTVDAAIVAGGGAGGGSTGGGGGAGGFIEKNSYTVTPANHPIVIGAGAGPGISTQLTTSGSNTTALSSTAIGGGGGSTSTNNSLTQHSGLNGGSGGGGSHYHQTGGAGAGTSGQGNAGGDANNYSGAGGGKGAAGGAGNAQYNGPGGVGLNWKSLGTYYAGGGGAENGLGGLGGGGKGVSVTGQPAHPNGESGFANTGGGGGTCWGYVSHNGGAGGSGIVVIRYAV